VFKYENFDPSHFLQFLKQGLFNDEINQVLERFNLYPPILQFELIKYIKEKKLPNVSLSVLSKVFNATQEDIRILLLAPFKEFKVIVADKDEAKLVRGLVISGTKKIITNNKGIYPELKVIKKWYGSGFAVFFEELFVGKSFMLPLAVALYIRNLPPNLVFTGKIDSKGNIFEVDNLDAKFKLARQLNLKLITPLHAGHINIIKQFLDRDCWDVPFYVTTEDLKEFDTFCKGTPLRAIYSNLKFFEGLRIFYDLHKEDFCIVTGQLREKCEWHRQCVRFYESVHKIKHTLFGDKLFHFGIRGPSTLAFSLGILWGSQEPFYIYHYQSGRYHQISVSNPRELKQRVRKTNLIEFEFVPSGNDLAIILQLAHHELFADAREYINRKLRSPSFLWISHITSGNVQVMEFKQVVKEIASVIQDIRKTYTFENFHFFFSCPVPIAFMLGVAFGHYSEGVVYNYQKGEDLYMPVVELSFLRKIREDRLQVHSQFIYSIKN